MASNFTRFYLDTDEDCRTGCLNGKAFEDVDRAVANEFERRLQEEEIPYIRVDL